MNGYRLCSTEPNIVWHTRRDGRSRRRRRGPADDALREAAAALVPLLRLEHLPPDCDLLQQVLILPPHYSSSYEPCIIISYNVY